MRKIVLQYDLMARFYTLDLGYTDHIFILLIMIVKIFQL